MTDIALTIRMDNEEVFEKLGFSARATSPRMLEPTAKCSKLAIVAVNLIIYCSNELMEVNTWRAFHMKTYFLNDCKSESFS